MLGVVSLASMGPRAPLAAAEILLTDRFDPPDRLLTNEYARWNPSAGDAVLDDRWMATAGSLLVRDGRGWSGPPDTGTPDARSTVASGSSTLRVQSRREDLGDVTVSLTFRLNAFASTGVPHDWDGLHLLVRHHGEEELYAVSLARRDGRVDIKRKLPGGDVNGGTYATLADIPRPPLALGVDHQARVVVRNRPSESVEITLELDGEPVTTVVDHGDDGGRALTNPGALGIRADNLDFEIDDVLIAAG